MMLLDLISATLILKHSQPKKYLILTCNMVPIGLGTKATRRKRYHWKMIFTQLFKSSIHVKRRRISHLMELYSNFGCFLCSEQVITLSLEYLSGARKACLLCPSLLTVLIHMLIE